ncbi:MAG: hypothetical protein LAO78_00445 [Acidobacteriia bacterium]|nr:hypothetical protein [Terriglobia bacterium]
MKKLAIAVFMLLFAGSYAGASGKKVWSINVRRFEYRGDRTRTIVRWRGPYVVIGSFKFIRDEINRQCVLAFDPNQPLLVFDTVRRMQVPKEILGAYESGWEPPRAQKNSYPCAQSTRFFPSLPIISMSPELSYEYSWENEEFIVSDIHLKEKYRIPALYGCWGTCFVSDRTGSRFALLEEGQTWAARIVNAIEQYRDDIYTNKKVMRIFSSQDGKKLFEHSWLKPVDCRASGLDLTERVAFSDGGEMVAVLGDDADLEIFRISDN